MSHPNSMVRRSSLLVAVAGLASVAAAQFTVTGTYDRVIRVQLQIEAPDPNSPPDAPVPLIGLDQVDVRFTAETVATLSAEPTPANTAVDVLDFRMNNFRITFEDRVGVNMVEVGTSFPTIIEIDGDDLAIDFRDDGTADLEIRSLFGPGSALIDYDVFMTRVLGTFDFAAPGFDPLSLDLTVFNDFISEFLDFEYQLLVEDGEVVQQIGIPFTINLFDAPVFTSDFFVLIAPAVSGERFEFQSPLIAPCDEGANPSGTFPDPGRFIQSPFGTRHIELADANNDGHADIIALSGGGANDEVVTLLNRGDGTFDDFIFPSGAPVDTNSRGLAVADFNQDGNIDAAVVGTRDDGLEVLFGNGDGTFTLVQKFEDTTDFGTNVAVGDLNGDGDIDIVDVSNRFDLVNIFLNDGAGQFAIDTSLPVGPGPGSIILADFDGDQTLDIAVTSADNGTVDVFLNTGGGFASAASLPVNGPFSVGTLRAADVNADGDVDLAVSSFNDDVVTVFLNTGGAVFGAGTAFSAGDGPGGFTFTDLDGDTDLDLVVAANEDGAVALLMNDGSGNFSAPTLLPGVLATAEVEAADLDGDGDPELVADQFLVSQPDGIRVYRNGCPATSSGPTPCSLADLAEPFGIVDLDDVDAFIPLFLAGDPAVDLAPAFGIVDLDDVNAFITLFLAGCP